MQRVIVVLASALLLLGRCENQPSPQPDPTQSGAPVATQHAPDVYEGISSGYKGTDPR
jgi:hypothetical protein